MTRKILCLNCFREIDLAMKGEPPAVFHKGVKGNALGDYLCDHCGGEIEILDECVAFSVWRTDLPYTPWESVYILPIGEKRGVRP